MQQHRLGDDPKKKPQLSGGAALALPLQPTQDEENIDLHVAKLKKLVRCLEPLRRLQDTGPPRLPWYVVL